jgi:hypothetical protein
MEQKIITAGTEDEIWEQVAADLSSEDYLLEYTALLQQDNQAVYLDIDIDPGGGFEGGYEFTTLKSYFTTANSFKFSIHKDGFIDDLGKLFGMQDVVIGYPEFDAKMIIKTNDEALVKQVFKDPSTRSGLMDLDDFKFQLSHKDDSSEGNYTAKLKLVIEEAVIDPMVLRSLYHSFCSVLSATIGLVNNKHVQ